ncbi:MAG: DsbA family protein [Candidatus Levybacteria bacterium]|nr:DsbA family protein [Candidatus Levybacteria bacterium]
MTENKDKGTITIPLPSANKTQLVLTILLIVASFLLGSLWTKVQYLEKNGASNTRVAAAQTTPQTAAPNQPGQRQVVQAPSGKIKDVTNNDHIRGNKNAKITLVEYSDLECPFCKRFHPTMQDLMKTYGDKIRWVYRHFPLSFHQNAEKEAEATECIAELGGEDAFWTYVDKIFEKTTSNGTGFALDQLGSLAAEVGVNQSAFQSCLDGGKYAQLVKDQIADGSTGGVSGTPSTFLIDANGKSQLIVGAQPIDAFKTEIDKMLK